MNLLLIAAASIGIIIGGEPVGIDDISPPGLATVNVEADGHPREIAINALAPDGGVIIVEICLDTTSCSRAVTVTHGFWVFVVTNEYRHLDPDGGPYVWVGALGVNVIDPVVVFIDGFENGTTNRWSATQGGV